MHAYIAVVSYNGFYVDVVAFLSKSGRYLVSIELWGLSVKLSFLVTILLQFISGHVGVDLFKVFN